MQKELERQVAELYQDEREQKYNSNDFYKLFCHIYQNQLFYQTYFKLEHPGSTGALGVAEYDTRQAAAYYGDRYIDYHIEFFRHGLNAIIKKWLHNGCRETPQQMAEVLRAEYGPK